MSHQEDSILSVYNFIKQTPEGNLRKMLIDTKLTDPHFRLLMKLAKGASEAEFCSAFQAESFGKLRLSAKEIPLKETLWPISKDKLTSLGLLPKVTKSDKPLQNKAA